MSKLRKSAIRVRYMRSKHDDFVRETDEWLHWFQSTLACKTNEAHTGLAWRESPTPIDVTVTSTPKGSLASTHDACLMLMETRLYRALRSHLAGMLVGKVSVAQRDRRADVTDKYVTVTVAPAFEIYPWRSEDGAHWRCPGCGRFMSANWADEGIVESSLAGRQIWGDESQLLFIDESLVRELGLRKSFPDLVFLPHRVIQKPEDGDVLPGDPGWTGTFKPQKTKLARFGVRKEWRQ